MKKKISLIIPSYNDKNKLTKLLSNLKTWQAIPNEIIIIDSSQKKFLITKDFKRFIKKFNIRFLLIHKKNLFPGHARNIGIVNSTNSLLAFLDTSTLPNSKWLYNGLKVLSANSSEEGVWGNTYYLANTFFAKILRASTVGTKPIKTFPGSIMKKNIFNKCGLFIESVRAGEDGDLRSRLEIHQIKMYNSREFLTYDKFNFLTISLLLKKWFRNYISTSKLPFSRTQKDFYFYVSSFILIILAYNWNNVVASWDTNSSFYMPNITKISIFLIFISYIFTRGILVPKKKGVSLNFIFPVNFIFISFLSMMLDMTKILAFALNKLNLK